MKQCFFVITVLVLSMVLATGCTGPEAPITTPTTAQTPENGLFLTVIQPTNESITNVAEVVVIGTTLPSAVLSINGQLADVDEKGDFNMMVTLEEGPNVIDVIASDVEGNQKSQSLAVIYVPSEASETNFFLNILQPISDSTITSDKVDVKGYTSPGAVVTVNGELAEVDRTGSFTLTVMLEEGPNLIEVIASEVEGNQESSTLVVIYVP